MSKFENVTASQKKALAIATVLALVFGFYFLRHYTVLIIFAAIMAYLFNPYYQKKLAKNKNSSKSASQTFIFATLAILIPLGIIITLTILQINHTVNQLGQNLDSTETTKTAQGLIDSANNVLAKTPTDFRVSVEWIQTTSIDVAQKAGNAFLKNVGSYLGGFFSFFTTAIIFIFVFLSLLKNQKTLLDIIRSLNPLGPEISDLYTRKIAAMTKAMVRGQFVIAIAQGFTDAALIYIGGVHEAFFFFLMILTLLSFIPLGGGILAIPIGIVMILTGNVVGGALVIIGHLLIVTNIDNVLRPKLVPSEAKLDSALTILSVFSGIALLGFLGVIVGPVIMIIIVTTISVYLDVYKNIELKEIEEPAKSKTKIIHRVLKKRNSNA